MVDDEFTAFVFARGPALRRTAFLMTGDWHRAEDLTQSALAKLYVAWPRVDRLGAEDYARQVLVRTVVDSRRRFWSRERPTAELPDVSVVEDQTESRVDLLRALASLPAEQRAILVLRFWEDMSVGQVAGVLALSQGTVKSRTARALDRLRSTLGVATVITVDSVSTGKEKL
jgi:RNA polymerase sigma-70 factor (sigma-E family)